MADNFTQKVDQIKELFSSAKNTEEKYELIIEMGKKLKPLKDEYKIPQNRIEGCQSTTYIRSFCKKGNLYFEASSDALISSGLVSILLQVYNGESPINIVKNPPVFLKQIGIESAISPNRANGLYEMFTRMQKDALLCTVKNTNKKDATS